MTIKSTHQYVSSYIKNHGYTPLLELSLAHWRPGQVTVEQLSSACVCDWHSEWQQTHRWESHEACLEYFPVEQHYDTTLHTTPTVCFDYNQRGNFQTGVSTCMTSFRVTHCLVP